MNQVRPLVGRQQPFSLGPWLKIITALLRKDFTAADLVEVVDWRAAECRTSGDWQWFKPDTMFRSTKFPGYLDSARAGIVHTTPGADGRPQLSSMQITAQRQRREAERAAHDQKTADEATRRHRENQRRQK